MRPSNNLKSHISQILESRAYVPRIDFLRELCSEDAGWLARAPNADAVAIAVAAPRETAEAATSRDPAEPGIRAHDDAVGESILSSDDVIDDFEFECYEVKSKSEIIDLTREAASPPAKSAQSAERSDAASSTPTVPMVQAAVDSDMEDLDDFEEFVPTHAVHAPTPVQTPALPEDSVMEDVRDFSEGELSPPVHSELGDWIATLPPRPSAAVPAIQSLLTRKVTLLEEKIVNLEKALGGPLSENLAIDKQLRALETGIASFAASASRSANQPALFKQSAASATSSAVSFAGPPAVLSVDTPQYLNTPSAVSPEQLDNRNLHAVVPTQESIHSTFGASSQPDDVATNHAWTAEVFKVLHNTFNLPKFRNNQLAAINSTLAGQDVVVLMPTGGGKSLCYQLPALIRCGRTRGTTIVISPLISLMTDQVNSLKSKGIKADMVNSSMPTEARRQAFASLNTGLLDLAYVSPEMLSASAAMQNSLQRLHRMQKLARIVIDEAHCVSSWGHDFRPDYKLLENAKETYPGVPIMALTATANERVLLDILRCLRPHPLMLKQSFNRTNLTYEVRSKSGNVVWDIKDICEQYPGQSGIIYCRSKRDCEKLSEGLNHLGLSSAYYHAGLDADERVRVQQQWQQNEKTVICATVAFGMGIDKPDVRFVIHHTLPRNMEGYYQETGRAGRDGKLSACILFYRYEDARSLNQMIDKDASLTRTDKEKHKNLLLCVTQFCQNRTDCRRVQILQYFNESFDKADCHRTCDNCKNGVGRHIVQMDMTNQSRTILALLRQAQREVTLLNCVDALRGVRAMSLISKWPPTAQEYWGSLRDIDRTELERLFHHLVNDRVLEEYVVYNRVGFATSYIKLGSEGMRVLAGELKILMAVSMDDHGQPAAEPRASTTKIRRPRSAAPDPRPIAAANRKRAKFSSRQPTKRRFTRIPLPKLK